MSFPGRNIFYSSSDDRTGGSSGRTRNWSIRTALCFGDCTSLFRYFIDVIYQQKSQDVTCFIHRGTPRLGFWMHQRYRIATVFYLKGMFKLLGISLHHLLKGKQSIVSSSSEKLTYVYL